MQADGRGLLVGGLPSLPMPSLSLRLARGVGGVVQLLAPLLALRPLDHCPWDQRGEPRLVRDLLLEGRGLALLLLLLLLPL